MKKVLFFIALVVCFATVAGGQDAGQPVKTEKVPNKVKTRPSEEKMLPEPEVQLKRMSKGLQLTEEQQRLIKPVLDDQFARLNEIRQSADNSPTQIQKKVEGLRSDTISKIKTYLTPEQLQKFALISEKIKSSKQKRMMENRKARIGTQSDQAERPVL